jgi:pyroglutamyl-peptidase
MNVLLTGFEPFGGESINPAWEAVQRLQDTAGDGYHIHVAQLPCVFGAALTRLQEQIAAVHPQLVICVGQAGGRTEISVERVAINIDDARIPDNAGQQPIDEAIAADGPAAYFSTLPIKAIVAALRANGIPAAVSQTAGTYVCNHVFYGLAHLIATQFPHMRGGFIHIPYLPQQAAQHIHAPSMALDTIVQGLQLAISTCVHTERDLKLGGGETA